MDHPQWQLFSLRTRIEMRLLKLGMGQPRRQYIVSAIAAMTDIPRLTAFARRLDAPRRTF